MIRERLARFARSPIIYFYTCTYETPGTNTPFTLATENGSGTVRHGIRGSVNTIGLRGTVLARHGLKRRAGTVPRSTGSQCKLKRYRAEGWACV